ncbi:MAG: phosphopantetheine-binding protein [Eubacteriales bacterium]
MREEILGKIIERAAKLFGMDASEITEDTTFEECKAKSAHISQITTYLEDEYDVEVPFMGFRKQKTFGEAADFVEDIVENM